MIENRQHARYELEEPGFMRILGPPWGAFVVTILDISKSGLRVRCSLALPEGTTVELRCRSTQISGEVRYSRSVEAGDIHIGILAESVLGMTGEVDLTLLFPDLVQR
jgi:hypothetical protein